MCWTRCYARGSVDDRILSRSELAARNAKALRDYRSTVPQCVGDCDRTNDVTVDEVLGMINIALGTAEGGPRPAGDANREAAIAIDEIFTVLDRGYLTANNICIIQSGM